MKFVSRPQVLAEKPRAISRNVIHRIELIAHERRAHQRDAFLWQFRAGGVHAFESRRQPAQRRQISRCLLNSLLSIYPDAKFVQIHRDPIDAVASVSSLVTILRRVFSDDVDPIQIGRDAQSYWSQAIKTFLRVRDQLPAERVCDLRYDEIRHDPIAAARRVYGHFGWNPSREIEERMRGALAQQTAQTNGVHRYDAAYFRLGAMNGFEDYNERFGFSVSRFNQPKEQAEAAA